jgi:hypothetical protein
MRHLGLMSGEGKFIRGNDRVSQLAGRPDIVLQVRAGTRQVDRKYACRASANRVYPAFDVDRRTLRSRVPQAVRLDNYVPYGLARMSRYNPAAPGIPALRTRSAPA